MLVAITQKQEKNQRGDVIDTLEHRYIFYLQKCGIVPVPVSNALPNATSYLSKFPIQGLVISGGNDVDPASYGGSRPAELVLVPERDKTEKELLDYAVERKLPVLCICRGMQLLNVHFGGGLVSISKELGEGKHLPGQEHPLQISEPAAQDLLGKKILVNSYHNYGITQKTLSSVLRAFAKSPDGFVEGIYHPALPIAGIQWHPERKSPDEGINLKFIKTFIETRLFWEKR